MATIRTIQGPLGTRYTARIRFGCVFRTKLDTDST
jgi:hypothetical protein